MARRGPRYSEEEARAAVAAARSHFDAMVRLGVRPAGGNHATLKKYLALWEISTDHFDWGGARPPRREAIPLDEVLVEGSNYERKRLKRRLVEAGLKELRCEMCGQGEMWRGLRMGLVSRPRQRCLERQSPRESPLLCPNCNATLDTHCGRKNRREVVDRECGCCGDSFTPKYAKQRFCSRPCGVRHNAPALHRVERPPYDQLLAEIAGTSYSAVGRKYGVSDNAIRKWVRAYKRQRAREYEHRGEVDRAPPLAA